MIATILKAILEFIAAMSAPRATRDKMSRPEIDVLVAKQGEYMATSEKSSVVQNPSNSIPLDHIRDATKKVSGFKFSVRSLKALDGVEPDLVRVAKRALQLSEIDFVVTEGLRSIERQKEMFAQKKSRTMLSKHLVGRAIDIMAIDPAEQDNWAWPLYEKIARAFKQAGKELGVPIAWGGDFKSIHDGVHFELADGGDA